MSMTNQDPILAMLDAVPIDDEPVTDDDRRHIEEGWQAYRDGPVFSAEEIKGMPRRQGRPGPRGGEADVLTQQPVE